MASSPCRLPVLGRQPHRRRDEAKLDPRPASLPALADGQGDPPGGGHPRPLDAGPPGGIETVVQEVKRREPRVRVLVLTMHSEANFAMR